MTNENKILKELLANIDSILNSDKIEKLANNDSKNKEKLRSSEQELSKD